MKKFILMSGMACANLTAFAINLYDSNGLIEYALSTKI